MKILTKEILNNFSYSTMNGDREGYKLVKIDGRNYTKYGTFQAVTLVGDLCEVYDADVKSLKKVLFVGVARQHPRDIKVDKELAYEVAHLNALNNPSMIIEVGDHFTKYNWRQFAKNYIDTLDLNFVKTAKEIEAEDFEKMMDTVFTCDYFGEDQDTEKCNCEGEYLDF